MNEHKEDKQRGKSFAADVERLADIERTEKETAGLPEVDIRKLVATATEAYWIEREREKHDLQVDPVILQAVDITENVSLARLAARMLEKEFFVEMLLAVSPAGFVMVSAVLVRRSGYAPVWLPWVAGGTFALLAVILSVRFFYNENKFWIVKHSAGTTVGALLVAGLFVWNTHAREARILDNSLALGEYELGGVAVKSLESRHLSGKFLEPDFNSNPVYVRTETISNESAKYRANVDGLPGALVAEIGCDSGKLHWVTSSDFQLRAILISGLVEKMEADRLTIKTNQNSEVVMIDPEKLLQRLEVGDEVVVLAKPNPLTAMSIEKIGDGHPVADSDKAGPKEEPGTDAKTQSAGVGPK